MNEKVRRDKRWKFLERVDWKRDIWSKEKGKGEGMLRNKVVGGIEIEGKKKEIKELRIERNWDENVGKDKERKIVKLGEEINIRIEREGIGIEKNENGVGLVLNEV